MNADTSLRLFDLTYEFIKDKDKAKEFVFKIEQTIDNKFINEKNQLASKTDLAETKVDLIKWMFGFWISLVILIVSTWFLK